MTKSLSITCGNLLCRKNICPADSTFEATGIHSPRYQRRSTGTDFSKELRYRLPYLNNFEDVEKYRSRGFHPIHLGDALKGGRYHVLHKLDYGGFSTVWLARDEIKDRLVSIKVLTADASRQSKELRLLRHLDDHAQANPWRNNIIAALDDFTIDGPNSTHFCYVSQPGGPNLSAISDSPGEIAGTRRLRAAPARKFARQLAKSVSCLHTVGIIHGGRYNAQECPYTTKRYRYMDYERTFSATWVSVKEEVFKFSGQKPDLSAPKYVVEPASFSRVDSEYISEQMLLMDFGEAFLESSPPANGVGTPVSCCSPKLILEVKASRSSDTWALACTIFEARSGFPLFESFVGSSFEVLEEIVSILGMPPESSHFLWSKAGVTFTNHAKWSELAVNERIREIGSDDQEVSIRNNEDTPSKFRELLEPLGNGITRDDEIKLTDLLRRALGYMPEKRISAEEVANHAWCYQ